MTEYRFFVLCPKCNKLSETVQAHRVPDPRVKCGDCLMEHVEVVEMKVVKVVEENRK